MTHTALLKVILEKAEAVQNEFHCDCLWPSHIAVAFADFCATEYTGFSVSDTYIHPNWYEEERLRLLYDKVVKYRSFFRLLLSKKIRGGYTEEPFQFVLCEQTAALRNHNVLSADLVFAVLPLSFLVIPWGTDPSGGLFKKLPRILEFCRVDRTRCP
jgi:hypothetical protein